MFKLMGKKKITILRSKIVLSWTYVLSGVDVLNLDGRCVSLWSVIVALSGYIRLFVFSIINCGN